MYIPYKEMKTSSGRGGGGIHFVLRFINIDFRHFGTCNMHLTFPRVSTRVLLKEHITAGPSKHYYSFVTLMDKRRKRHSGPSYVGHDKFSYAPSSGLTCLYEAFRIFTQRKIFVKKNNYKKWNYSYFGLFSTVHFLLLHCHWTIA